LQSVLNGFGEEDVHLTAADGAKSSSAPERPDDSLRITVRFGPSMSFVKAGRRLVESFTLNKKQTIAFLLICRYLDII
jgi:hypothetical protein